MAIRALYERPRICSTSNRSLSACASRRSKFADVITATRFQPWGVRTASFRDPGGHIWEFAN
jgi:uncharacterized glyoxalase superfamily protein PhnB